MDIRNNKNILNAKIKRFTLKATASAILALNAEIVMANCPAEISENLATICNFPPDDGGTSFTVENGGTVQGFLMDSNNGSSITIDAGGQVNNTVTGTTGIGINITNSSLSNGISNSGTINSTRSTGIKIIHGSSVSGGISNGGSITAANFGINIISSAVDGGISNSAKISSNLTGIVIQTNSTITGNIFNSGTISITGVDNGIGILHSNIIDDIVNSDSGSIISTSGNGIYFNNSTGKNIINNGIINTGGSGIAILSTTISGNISNTGSIIAGSTTNPPTQAGGIGILNDSNVGGVSNSGKISNSASSGIGIWIKNGHITGTGTGDITNTGTISATGISGVGVFIGTGSTVANSLVNNGTISGGLTGLAVISSAISGGIYNSGIIQGGTNAIRSDSPVDINIQGQSARIIGNVEAAGSTVNITNGAIFTSEGDYNVFNFNIDSNAVFNMANSITVATSGAGATGVSNSGTLAIADSLQTLTGNYTQNLGGTFQTGVSNASSGGYGQLLVTGTADLSQSGNIYVQLDRNSSLHPGDVLYNVIQSTGAFTSNGFNPSSNSYIWIFTAALNNLQNGVDLTTTLNPNAYKVCQGAYCQGALNTIIKQVTSGNSLFGPYAALPTANELRDAASQATPELTNENIQVTQLITRAVIDVIPMLNSLRGISAGDAMIYQPGKLWVKPYGASMSQGERNTVNGFNASAYGGVIGKDIPLPNDWLLGGAFAAGGDNMRGSSILNVQSIDSNAYQGMVYASKKLPYHTYVAGQGLVGYEINDTSRVIPLYNSTAKGSFNNWFTNVRAEAGWSTTAFSPKLIFTPEIDASYLFINQGSYQESGSPMDLLVATQNNSSLVLGAYANSAYYLTELNNQHDLTLTGYAGVAGDVINSQPQTISTFVAGGSSFSTFGVQFNGAVFRGGAGLIFTSLKRPIIVELNYDLQVGNNAYSGVGAATFKYKL